MSTIKRKFAVMLADPAGNKTAFVLNGARQKDYRAIANAIFDIEGMDAEQVAFVTGTSSIEMSGMEFCGNAARAFGLISASGLIDGHDPEASKTTVPVSVSGTKKVLECDVDLDANYAGISMPTVKRVKELKACGFEPAVGKKIMVMDGIVHLIADGIEYTPENFKMISEAVMQQLDPEAVGVLYLDPATLKMTPVTFVKDICSTYVEGSCGSGSVAAASFLSMKKGDGEYSYELKQPGGTIKASVEVKDGKTVSAYIEGAVALRDPEYIELEYESEDEDPEDIYN